MTGSDYRFERRSRRAALAALAGAGLGLSGGAAVKGDLWLAALGLLLPLPLLWAARFRPPSSGAAIESGRLSWWTGGGAPDSVELSQIKLASASDAGIRIELADGSGRLVPRRALPDRGSALTALRARGVPTATA